MAGKTGIDRAIDKMEVAAAETRIELTESAQSFLPLPELAVDQGKVIVRRAGRKKGAVNASTRKMIEALQKMGRVDPLDALSAMISRPVEVIKVELACTLFEAAKFQKSAAEALLPFYHARRAPENADGDAMPEFAIYAGIPGQGPQKDYLDFTDPKLIQQTIESQSEKVLDNQTLSEGEE